jgi:hypothetical protein
MESLLSCFPRTAGGWAYLRNTRYFYYYALPKGILGSKSIPNPDQPVPFIHLFITRIFETPARSICSGSSG